MNRIQIGGYTRITKKEAARRYNAGEVIRLTACKLSPVSPWGCYSDAQRESYTQVSGGGLTTTVARTREFAGKLLQYIFRYATATAFTYSRSNGQR